MMACSDQANDKKNGAPWGCAILLCADGGRMAHHRSGSRLDRLARAFHDPLIGSVKFGDEILKSFAGRR